MIYVCGSMYRSGSTWLYNAMRLTLEHAGVPDFAAGWITDKDKLLAHKNSLVKIHEFSSELASPGNVILTAHRDLRDVAASLCRKYNFSFELQPLRDTVRAHAQWARLAPYDLHYENLHQDKLRELRAVAENMRLPDAIVAALPYQAILEKIDRLEFSKDRSAGRHFDSVTLLHPGHFTDGRHGSWNQTLPVDFVRAIEKEFGPWLTSRGYLS